MPVELQTALIAAIVALVTSAFSGFFAWRQIQRERIKWLTDLKSTYAVELYKARLSVYPGLQEIMRQLSWREYRPITSAQAQETAIALNDWLYSVGGLIAEPSTRAAITGLRKACLLWKEGPEPHDILEFRNILLLLMRRDLDITGLGSEKELQDQQSLLKRLQEEVRHLESSRS